MSPTVVWRRVDPADVISAATTLARLPQEGRSIVIKGQGVDELLAWGNSELDLAELATTDSDKRRHAVQAVSHAKRAIDWLFDAYLERDLLNVHLHARPQFQAKLNLLKMRHGRDLPWRMIPAVVALPRDVAEHDRRAPSVAEAGVAVEASRVITSAMQAASHPLRGPVLAGRLHGGFSMGPWGHHTYVTGFPSVFAWIWRCDDGVERAGVGTSSAPNVAEVIFSDLRQFTVEQHVGLLRSFDSFEASAWIGEDGLREQLRLAGLSQPSESGLGT